MHAQIENGLVVKYPIINLRQELPEISLPEDLSDDAALPAGYVYVAQAPFPPYDPNTQELVPNALPTLSAGRWQIGYTVQAMTPEEMTENTSARQAAVDSNRRTAYTEEADPIFFKWQRGEATQQQWLDKVAEIKARYPDVVVP